MSEVQSSMGSPLASTGENYEVRIGGGRRRPYSSYSLVLLDSFKLVGLGESIARRPAAACRAMPAAVDVDSGVRSGPLGCPVFVAEKRPMPICPVDWRPSGTSEWRAVAASVAAKTEPGGING